MIPALILFLKKYKWMTVSIYCESLRNYFSVAPLFGLECRAVKSLMMNPTSGFTVYYEDFDSVRNPNGFEGLLTRARFGSRSKRMKHIFFGSCFSRACVQPGLIYSHHNDFTTGCRAENNGKYSMNESLPRSQQDGFAMCFILVLVLSLFQIRAYLMNMTNGDYVRRGEKRNDKL